MNFHLYYFLTIIDQVIVDWYTAIFLKYIDIKFFERKDTQYLI